MNCRTITTCLATLLGATFATSTVRAEIRTEPVEYHDGPTLLKGFLAYDDATQDVRPGVLVCPEWWGLTDYPKHRAEELAKLGYVAFVADLYGDGRVTADPAEAGAMHAPLMADRKMLRQRTQAALDTLTAHKLVDKTRIAAIGYCFGGAAAIELARAGAPLVGVVSFHGDLSRTPDEGPDHITAKVLVCHGGADTMVTPATLASFEQEMKEAGVDCQINIYSGAKHAFTNPAADTYHLPPVGYNEEADHRSFAAMKDFLAEVFKQ
jgi:dienelactone hydrolase